MTLFFTAQVEVLLASRLFRAESPITTHDPQNEGKGQGPVQPSPQQNKEMEKNFAQMKRKMSMEEIGLKIKHKIMVLSGKGGVGKSTVSTGLALSLAQLGHKVGILDIDITGPNVPKMMGLDGHKLHVEEGRIHPAKGHLGVKVISMAFLLDDPDTPVVWRGPTKLGAIEPLTVSQSLPNIDGMVIVTTPQAVALLDSRKSITFAESLKVPVLGVVENMSGYTINGVTAANVSVEIAGPGGKTIKSTSDEDGNFSVTLDIFKKGGGKSTAEDFGVPFLGALPFDPGFVRGGDDGVHKIVSDPEGASSIAFSEIVKAVLAQISDKPSSSLEII